jgi:hypothetical protein
MYRSKIFNLKDLKDLDADVYRGLISLENYEKDDVEDAFLLFFNAPEEVWGSTIYVDLKV